MSKKKKTFEAPVDAVATTNVDGVVAPVAVAVEASKAKKKRIKPVCSRVWAFIVLVACAAIAIVAPLAIFTAKDTTVSKTLVATVQDLFASGTPKLWNFLPVLFEADGILATLSALLPYIVALFLVVAVLFALIGGLFGGKRCSVKTALVFVMLAGIAQLAIAYLGAKKWDMYAIVIAAAALLLLILVCITTRAKKEEPAPVEEPIVVEPIDPYADFHTEEIIEAYAYEGGPVAGIEIAEEVYPTVASIEAQKDPDGAARNTVASLLGNGFDAFLITLNEKEKNEFIDLYVLKCKGIMPEIPGYVVGGDNKEFFNKVFIYLGQYRDKIPADLLAKMYAFAMKI